MGDFCRSKGLRSGALLSEGGPAFADFRDCVLREAERSLFLSAALMRWSFNLYAETASYWAHSTLYYAGFFAAKAILATQGGWFDGRRWQVTNVRDHPGSQQFEVRTVRSSASSHENFWDEYYPSVAGLGVWLGSGLTSAVSPVNGDPGWLTRTRNLYNYTPARSFEHMAGFKARFNPAAFPSSLNSELATQFEVSRSLLEAAFKIAKACNLKTDVFSDRKTDLVTTVFRATAPDLGSQVSTLEAALS